MSYAFVDDLEYRRWGAIYVGDKLVEKVPRLAICVNLGGYVHQDFQKTDETGGRTS